jgi:protein-S-isoprenylcysteine O-methyltransferase Ste14
MPGLAGFRRSVIVSILFVVFGGPAIGVVYAPLWITHFRIPATEPWWQMVLAGALIAVGLAPGLESAWRFIRVGRGTLVPGVFTERLVVSGFYRYVRNPMYIGVVIALAGEAALFRSRAMVAYALLMALGFHLFVCLYEERALARRYPDEYLRYKRHVRRWLPRLYRIRN